MTAVTMEYPFADGREVPAGAQEHVSMGRRVVRAVVHGAGVAAGFTWRAVKATPVVVGTILGFAVGAFEGAVVTLWRLMTPLVRGLIVTALATAILFGTAAAIHMAAYGLLGLGLFTVAGEVVVGIKRYRAKRATKRAWAEAARQEEAVDVIVANAVSSKREQKRRQREENMNSITAGQNVAKGTEVYMIWTEKQYRAFNNRRREIENYLSEAQENDDKQARSEFAGRLHILLRRWHCDERGIRTLRDEFKAALVTNLGESEAGRQYNWTQMLTHMKDEDAVFTQIMSDAAPLDPTGTDG